MKKTAVYMMAFCMALSLVAFLPAGSFSAETTVSFPRNVEVQVAAAPGGGTDVMARAIYTYISKKSGSNFNIVNNADGGGVISFERVRNAEPDGSVIEYFTTTMLLKTATGLYDKAAAEDFIVMGAGQSIDKISRVLLVSADSDMKTLDDLIAKAKAQPGQLLFGVEMGGVAHILSGMFARAAGVEVKFVEAGPDTEKLTTLIGRNIDATFVNVNQAKQYMDSGRAIALAGVATTDKGERSEVIPDVPTFKELGLDFHFNTINFQLAPKGMDPALAQLFYDYFIDALQADEVNAILGPAGFQMDFFSYEDSIARIRAQQQELNEVAEAIGIKQR